LITGPDLDRLDNDYRSGRGPMDVHKYINNS
jgi:hypothetical protein